MLQTFLQVPCVNKLETACQSTFPFVDNAKIDIKKIPTR